MDPYLPEFSATVFLATPPVGGWPSRFAVVTACNENGDRDADAANLARTAELRKILDDTGHAYFPVTGCSPDLLHREPGFGCETGSLDVAIALGRRYNQLAVWWIEHNNLELVYVGSGRRHTLGSWSARVKGTADHA